MSAQPIEKSPTDGSASSDHGSEDVGQDNLGAPTPERSAVPEQIEVRHQAAVSALLGVATSAVAIAYLWRAASTGAAFDWLLCVTLAALSVGLFRNLLDARLPLLVADELGVRFRLGRQWRGLPWEAVDRIVVSPRRGVLRDGRLVVNLHHMHRAIEGIEGRARRHARLNQKMYGAVLAVPLGLTTRITHATEETLQERFAELAHGRADVVTLLPEPEPVPASRRPDHDAITAPAEATGAAGAANAGPDDRHVIGDDEQLPIADRRPRWLRRGSAAEEPAEAAEAAEAAEPPKPPTLCSTTTATTATRTTTATRASTTDRPAAPWPPPSTRACVRWHRKRPPSRPSPPR